MSLEIAFTSVTAAINSIPGLPNAVLKFRHPDDPAMAFPWLGIEWDDENLNWQGLKWTNIESSEASFAVFIHVNNSSDSLSLELIRWAQKVKDAIKALSLSTTNFRCKSGRSEPYSPPGVRWATVQIQVIVGAYE